MANTGVTGRVVFAGTNNGIPNLEVTVVDVDTITSEDILGTNLTDFNGEFSISYSTGNYRIWSVAGENPDIEVRIYGDGHRLLWETRVENDVQVPTLNVGTIEIHGNNFRVPDTASAQQRKDDPYWLVTHTTFDPANGAAVRLTRGNQIDWLVDGAPLFPDVTDRVNNAGASVKLMNMAFDAKGLISSFDFGAKNHQTVEAGDVVVVHRLGEALVNRAKAGKPVNVLLWELEEGTGGGIGDLFGKADGADAFREFFRTQPVKIATLKTSQLLHVKLIVIDGKIGYITGSTMKQGYFADQDHLLRDGRHGVVHPGSKSGERQLTHDVSLRVEGPSVRFIDETFSTIWNAADPPAPAPAPQVGPIGGANAPVGVQILRTLPGGIFTTPVPDPNVENLPHGETGVLEAYQRAIMKAEEYIYIEDQYFNSPEIATAIQERMIEKPLLEVILVLNARPDIGGYHSHQASLIKELFESLGNQPDRLGVFTMWSTDASQPRFEVAQVYMHSKVAIIDDKWAAVGTANVDGASMNQRQWQIILPGLIETIFDKDDLEVAMILLWFPIVLLVLLVTAPVLMLDSNLRGFIVDAIRREFARGSQHAAPHREQQPLRHCEIDMVVYNDIAGEPATGNVKELRESLWTEMLGAPPPATRPSDGWVRHWKSRADDLRNTIRNASDEPPTVVPTKSKILEWVAEREYEAYLREVGVKTKNIRLRDKGVSMSFEVV